MEKTLQKIKDTALTELKKIQTDTELNDLYLKYLGTSGEFTRVLKMMKDVPKENRPVVGKMANSVKQELENAFEQTRKRLSEAKLQEKIDVTLPGKKPPVGHLHIVSEAITEITGLFERIGFTRVQYPEIEWEWYAFEALNMPKNHPARDDFETFFIDAPPNPKLGKLVLTPHTSSGQVREMERLQTPPIRMINIAKTYRPNWDISHTPMFHQFEGLVVDYGITIAHLKGTLDYFAREFFGPERKTRLRPFHFQFTEPSFEVDITCDVCNGKGCRLCKEGWLELGGAGMVHPNVLKAGKIDPSKYTGFAFGWGVERTYMMKQGLRIDDIRLLYSNDIRFLEQF